MNKLGILSPLFLTLILFISCDPDGDGGIINLPTEHSGTYIIHSMTNANCNDAAAEFDVIFDMEDCVSLGLVAVCREGTMDFKSDGTFTADLTISFPIIGNIFEQETTGGTHSKSGNTLTLCMPDGSECFDYEIDGDDLRHTTQDASTGCDITVVLRKQ